MALEAAVVGCAVIVCDARGCAGLLTAARLTDWRKLNLGVALLTRPTTPDALHEAIAGYDPDDAAIVTDRLRAEASLDAFIQHHLTVYAAALADPGPPDPAAHASATATWIEDLTPSAATRDWHLIAREIFRLHAVPPTEYLSGMEQRLLTEIEHQGAVTRDALTGLTVGDAFRALWWRFVPVRIRLPMHRSKRRLPVPPQSS
jgi:hypothetical protein